MSEIDYLRKLLKEQKLTLALGESVTCGLAAYKMNSRPGTSEIFKGSVVAYNEDVKKNLLKIDAALIETYSAESQEVTDAMVAGLQNLIKADVYAAITGLAGTGGTESKKKPVGTIFISVLYNGKISRTRKRFYGSPFEVKRKACSLLFSEIAKAIEKE